MKITSIQIRTCVGQLENIIKSKHTIITPELIRACLDPVKNNLTQPISDRAQRNLLIQLQALLSKASKFTHSKQYIEALSSKIERVLDRKEEKASQITPEKKVQKVKLKNYFEVLPTLLEEDETPYMAMPNTASDERLGRSKIEENNKKECVSDSGIDSPISDEWVRDSNGNTAGQMTQSSEIEQILKAVQSERNRKLTGACFFKSKPQSNRMSTVAESVLVNETPYAIKEEKVIPFSGKMALIRITACSLINRANIGKDIIENAYTCIRKDIMPIMETLTPDKLDLLQK